jgi:hypothetical protein
MIGGGRNADKTPAPWSSFGRCGRRHLLRQSAMANRRRLLVRHRGRERPPWRCVASSRGFAAARRREAAMDADPHHNELGEHPARDVTSTLHPRIYALAIVFALWFALAVWSFAGAGVTDYLLFIVSGFVVVVVALQLILSRVGRSGGAMTRDDQPPPLRAWAALDFDTWAGRLSGTQAAMQILLPIAAAAVGMTAIGIIYYIAEHSV